MNQPARTMGAVGNWADRAARGVAVALITVPAMLIAHLVTAGAVPPPYLVAVVSGVVAVTAAATPAHRRGLLAAAVGLAQAAGHTALAVLAPLPQADTGQGCLSTVGRGAEVGLRLALLRHDTLCPSGGLAVGATTVAAAATVLAALLVLAGHTAIALFAAALVVAVRTVVLVVATLAGLPAASLTRPSPVGAPRRLTASPATGRPVTARWTPRPPSRRGPPVPTAV